MIPATNHRPHWAWPLSTLLTVSLAAVSPACAQVKLGFQAPLTGAAATDGKSAKIAADMAIEKINAGGGVLSQKMELVPYDDQAKTEEAVFTANKLVGQDGVKFAVSGSYSASGRAAAPIFQKAAVPFISAYGVHPDITRSGDYVFRGVHLGPPRIAHRILLVLLLNGLHLRLEFLHLQGGPHAGDA